jgi:hypothetical protein
MSDVEIRFADLQSRYTELLEKRIAQLEAAIAAPVIIPTPVAAATNGEEKKEDGDDSSDDEKRRKMYVSTPCISAPLKVSSANTSTENR